MPKMVEIISFTICSAMVAGFALLLLAIVFLAAELVSW